MQDDRIVRDLIVAFVIVKSNDTDVVHIDARPIAVSCNQDDFIDQVINPGEEIISITPAPPGCFKLSFLDESGELSDLGFEYPGATHTDWEKEILEDRDE
mgnify:CR=1 FL=1